MPGRLAVEPVSLHQKERAISRGPGLGATYLGDGRTHFLVWAPLARRIELHLLAPHDRLLPMERRPDGYSHAVVEGAVPGTTYLYRLDGERERPDPASRLQPAGVHGPSQVVDHAAYTWHDQGWQGLELSDFVTYELHVGTFTPEGTFEAIIPHLDELAELGITALELLPVAQFPGARNWGYDGVYPFAVHHAYGGPLGLQRLVDACHQRGLAVVLDVVYNHLGPEGNYLGEFGPYFTDRYRTPWGLALNMDGPDSDEVRRFFLENALEWITHYHIDALRLDAVHAIHDSSAQPFLQELAAAVHACARQLRRRVWVIAESDLNDARLTQPVEAGGLGLDAQWSDDFHHALHALLTGERAGYYQDFGSLGQLAAAYRHGFVYTGQYSPFRRRRHGNSPRRNEAHQFVVFAQNHDQVGNRAAGERLTALVSFESLKLAAGAVLLSPFLPLIFMGEEYGETAPFLYFTSHGDEALARAVRDGRRAEFAAFAALGEIPDPQAEATFLRSKLDQGLRRQGHHAVLQAFYGELLRLRRAIPALAQPSKARQQVDEHEEAHCLAIRRWAEGGQALLLLAFADSPATARLALPRGAWHKRLDSAEARWLGPGSPLPARIESEGEVRLTLPPRGVALYTLATEAAA